jgi:hypothetical protein
VRKKPKICALGCSQFSSQTRVIHKVRERQHQYLEFGHKQGDIFLKPGKEVHKKERENETQKTTQF